MIKRLQSPTWRVLAAAGFLQAFGVIGYCTVVATFIYFAGKIAFGPSVFAITAFLLLFVLSAAITGSLVFGYAAYLALNKKIKEALMDLAYVLLWSKLVILLAILVVTILIWYQPSLFV
jgi:hypothetical protein